MLQSLITLEEDQIDAVMSAVKEWCESRQVEIDSVEGLRAMNVAINIVCSDRVHNLLAQMRAHLDPPPPLNAA